MRFVPYEELDGIPNVIVDGSAHPDTVLTLSHWPGSPTPVALREDLSAQIAFRYLDEPGYHVKASAVSNNHLDQDGLTSVYALTDPGGATARRDQVIDVARAGDFGTFVERDSARIAWTIANLAFGEAGEGYPELLAMLPDLLDHPDCYHEHWIEEDAHLSATESAIASGLVTIEEFPELDLAVVTVPEGWNERTVHRFTTSVNKAVHPAAVHNTIDSFALLYRQGNRYEFQYRYETWIQYVSRHPRPRVDLAPLAEELTAAEPETACWRFDGADAIAPSLHLDGADASVIDPPAFLERLIAFLRVAPPAWNPYS